MIDRMMMWENSQIRRRELLETAGVLRRRSGLRESGGIAARAGGFVLGVLRQALASRRAGAAQGHPAGGRATAQVHTAAPALAAAPAPAGAQVAATAAARAAVPAGR